MSEAGVKGDHRASLQWARLDHEGTQANGSVDQGSETGALDSPTGTEAPHANHAASRLHP
jgi:hypothetical protein